MMKKLLFFLCALPLVAGCSADTSVDGGEIGLNGVISSSFDTKAAITADAYTETIPSSDHPLNADIWFSYTSGNYSDNTLHRTINYIGPSVTSPSPDSKGQYLRYDTKGTDIYCVGLYPQGKWTSSDGITAKAEITGKEDLMFASQKSGNNSNPLNSSPQIFNHQLTWVKIGVRSESHETGETWGHVKKIWISSADTAAVTLGTGSVSYSGDEKFLVFDGDKEMPIMYTEFASVMVSPALANASDVRYFKVSVECENHEREDIVVLLNDNEGNHYKGATQGKVFVLTLYFKTLESIEFTTTLSSWEDEGRVLELS